jgi:hypothetical protein
LSNSTISGVALGGNLFNLTAGTNITFSSGTTYNGSAAITINASSTMVYPGSGIPNSTGSAWGTSYSTSGTGTVVALATSASLTTPTVTGGTIDNAAIGGTTPAAGTFNTLIGGKSSTTYVTITGDASYPMIQATGGTNTPLVLSPLGTGALQAQKTDSTATGGNARGANAVDWQTSRGQNYRVASGAYSSILGGSGNTASGYGSASAGGEVNTASGYDSFIGGGSSNTASNSRAAVLGGYLNTAAGYYNVIGGGFTNTGTALAAVTTQSGTMNGTTAVTLSGSNASIKVGQYITGTSIAAETYVAAISGTSLTLSQNASGSSTSTLSFYTPHGVVVGGGNNQATGSYSFIGGGGDAGTAANRNVASGDWSVVAGGIKNTASGVASFIGGGGYSGSSIQGNTVSGVAGSVIGGFNNNNTGFASTILGGATNTNSSDYAVISGFYGTTRGIAGNNVFTAGGIPVAATVGGSQTAIIVLGRQTTDATATVLCSNSNAAGSTNQVILPNNSAYYFKAKIIAGVTGAGNTKAWTLEGAIKRGSGVGTAAIVGTVTTTVVATDAGAATWTVTATADTTNGGLAVTVTGQASTTIRWVCQVETTEMTY